jgi:FtsP/CotA-like multicopper oxidase with cupredoxin domain
MAEQTNVESSKAAVRNELKDASRREFVQQALVVSAGVALTGFAPQLKALAAPAAGESCTPILGKELVNPGEIRSGNDGVLQAVLRVHGEERQVSYVDVLAPNTPPACGTFLLRAYEGYSGTKIDKTKMVTKPGVYGPGPTFRAPVGDAIQIALLNHIDPRQFPETPNEACDVVTDATTGRQIYPGVAPKPKHPDKFPDCFRGSNTTNLHFHGTHVSPNAFSDNVLVEVVPDLEAVPEECERLFPVACKDYPNPQAWKHQDAVTEKALADFIQRGAINRLERLDQVQPEKNDPDLHNRQAAHNRTLEEYDEFPQFWAGCFPYCIRPPKYVPAPDGGTPKYEMGQAPGTHWYHAHKHGSTSIQFFNGMSGALILEGDYDKVLRATMPEVEEKVLVIQQFQVQPNRERTGGAGGLGKRAPNNPGTLVNGQLQPVITMKTGEVQWWRLINATVQAGAGQTMAFIANAPSQVPAFRQTAQDGVQFAWPNYASQMTLPLTSFMLAPGNRADILVQAPSTPGTATLVFGTAPATAVNIVLTVNVVSGSGSYNKNWPQEQAEYPEMPSFLSDITSVSECRIIKYEMTGAGGQPTINGKTFQEGVVNEAMLLGTQQEWTIENWTPGVRHPFHIHVNPFQIIETFDPNGTWPQPRVLSPPYVWWDTFAIPSAYQDPVTKKITPGYFKMRTRFADFAGTFVDHCHILAHEDRGMMQLIEVVNNTTKASHH